MRVGAAVARIAEPVEAARRVVGEARLPLRDRPPSLAVLFASEHFLGSSEALLGTVMAELGAVPLIGCVAEAVVGGAQEVEGEPAVALWLGAELGPVDTFAMEFIRTGTGGVFAGHRFERRQGGGYLMLCDPFTFPVDDLLTHLNKHVPGTIVMGGLASGGLDRRSSRLFLDGRVLSHGAVGVHLPQADIHPLVSQGCRPIGSPYTVTDAEGPVIRGLGGRPPLARLQDMVPVLPERDRKLLAAGVHVGILMDEYRAEPRQGDFLIRGVVGADPRSGAIAVGDDVEVGRTVQFHVRDAESADEDLRHTLQRELAVLGDRRAAGALLFTCNGRGSRLFDAPDHDAGLLAKTLGDIPVAGFFCAGELGPVGGRNFLHGFTASIALFVEP